MMKRLKAPNELDLRFLELAAHVSSWGLADREEDAHQDSVALPAEGAVLVSAIDDRVLSLGDGDGAARKCLLGAPRTETPGSTLYTVLPPRRVDVLTLLRLGVAEVCCYDAIQYSDRHRDAAHLLNDAGVLFAVFPLPKDAVLPLPAGMFGDVMSPPAPATPVATRRVWLVQALFSEFFDRYPADFVLDATSAGAVETTRRPEDAKRFTSLYECVLFCSGLRVPCVPRCVRVRT